MASTSAKPGHLERTAAEPRDKSMNTVVLRRVDQINDQIRIFRLEIPKGGPPIRFLPGQWLDVFIPDVPKAGGFTITSTPSQARSSATDADAPPGYIELAVQKAPDNPAAWLWQKDTSALLGKELKMRVGGSFVWPAPGANIYTLRKVVFVAGGVGINPLISMLSSIAEQRGTGRPLEVQFLYSMKDPGGEREADKMLFLERLATIFGREKVKGELKLFLTSGEDKEGVVSCNEVDVPFQGRRIANEDLEAAVGGPADRRFAVVYICGVPTMTDEFVEMLVATEGMGMEAHRVLCEKWW